MRCVRRAYPADGLEDRLNGEGWTRRGSVDTSGGTGVAVSDGRTIEGRSGLFALPLTRVGRWCAGLLAVSVVAAVLNTALLMPFTESRAGLWTVQRVVDLVIGLCVLASGGAGLWAVIRQRERSWVLFLAIALTAAVLTLNIVD